MARKNGNTGSIQNVVGERSQQSSTKTNDQNSQTPDNSDHKRPASASNVSTTRFSLSPEDNRRLANLCGPLNENLRLIEQRLDVKISHRSNDFQVQGESAAIASAAKVLSTLFKEHANDTVAPEQIHLLLQDGHASAEPKPAVNEPEAEPEEGGLGVRTRRGYIRGRGDHQREYLERILNHDINFGVGPAGTGKTYLAVACAVDALQRDLVRKLVLVRPAVEAGERLGFLPGDLSQKIDPYLRPLYDALYEMMGYEKVERLQERGVIEVAPLAYMRGRTLSESFVILDEAQNTTAEQMKMFLTRIGFGSRAVITGDLSQVDLPRGTEAGLLHALRVLRKVPGLSVTEFDAEDVVRHPLVQRIVRAYDKEEARALKATADKPTAKRGS